MKSVEQHKRDGTFQPCRHADRGTTMQKIEGVSCPSTITDKKVKKLWDQVVGHLCEHELVTLVDVPELEHAFYCYEKAMECRAEFEKFDNVTEYLKQLKFHEKDMTKEYVNFMRQWEKVLYKFGMTPVEASKVRTNVKKDDDGDDLIKALLGNG